MVNIDHAVSEWNNPLILMGSKIYVKRLSKVTETPQDEDEVAQNKENDSNSSDLLV